MWTGPLVPPAFLVAGLAGGIGLAEYLALRLDPSRRGLPQTSLAAPCAAAAAGCALMALALPTPQGFASATTLWWHTPEALCLLLAAAALAARRHPARLAFAAGPAALLSALLLYWKLINMGQAFARNAATVADKAALLDIISGSALMAVAGAAGLLLALAALLPILLPEQSPRAS